jgi:nitrogen fixation protein FixH
MTELKGWHVLAILLAFFGVTIGVNAYFITVALTSATGEYQKKSYLQGLRYNDVIAARARQAQKGWTAELAAGPAMAGTYQVDIRIVDRAARPVNHLNLSGELRRPVQAAQDQTLMFHAVGEGLYRAHAKGAVPGKWHVVVAAADATSETVFRAEKELWLP